MPTLDWIGKKAVVKHHLEVPYRLLKCDGGMSAGEPGEGNLLVQGDNLEALKALLPYYGGKVKCIYIDPPYNIGNEKWIYNDNVNSPEIQAWLGKVVGGELEDFTRHDKWLCMMYPRLVLLYQFLSEKGVCFVSIDENEDHRLRFLLDEIFGPQNFVEQLVWNKRIPKNDKGIGSIHEYVLLYVKNPKIRHEFKMPKEGLQEVYEFVQKLKRRKTPIPEAENQLKRFYSKKSYDRGITLYNNLDDDYRIWGKINVSWPNSKNGPRYTIEHPKTRKSVRIPDNGWRWKEETFQGLVDYKNTVERYDDSFVCGRIWFAKDERTQPSFIQYLDDVESLLLRSIISLKSDGGMELEEIIPNTGFPHPKPTELIKLLLASFDTKDAIIMDSFAGTGTTAHAVMKQNEMDGGQRRFILVEMDEKIAQDITAERLKRVIKGYGDTPGLAGGFRYCRLGPTLFNEKGEIREEVGFSDLAHHVYFTETGEPMSKRPDMKTPLLGVHNGRAVYLLFNGILDDKRPKSGNVLTGETLKLLPKHNGPKTVYGTACRLGAPRLRREGVTFRQIPYEIRVK